MNENFKPRTIITYAVIGTFLYLALKDATMKETLVNLLMVLQGYWFGSRQVGQKQEGEQKT